MSDLSLRLLERAFRATRSDEAFQAYQRERANLGLEALCHECRESEAVTVNDNDEPECRPCRDSALVHGHHHGLHTLDPGPHAECPLCREDYLAAKDARRCAYCNEVGCFGAGLCVAP